MTPLCGIPEVLGPWVFHKMGSRWLPKMGEAFGVADEQGIACAVAFTEWNGPNISVHIAVERPVGLRWLLWAVGQYTFVQLGCTRLTLVAESSNIRAVRLHERLGAIHEATLVGAGRNGDDILISRLTSDCPLWRKLDGKVKRNTASSTRLREPDPASGTVEFEPVQHDARRIAGELGNALR